MKIQKKMRDKKIEELKKIIVVSLENLKKNLPKLIKGE
ncbi:MAG: hypothetical protein ACJASR_000134 [Psychroserpens sp.]|jgi:hypothetical protein